MKLRRLKLCDADRMLEWMHDSSVVEYLQADFKDKTINKIILHSLYNNEVHEFDCTPNDEKQSIELLDSISSNIIRGIFEKNKQNCNKCEFNVRFCKNK